MHEFRITFEDSNMINFIIAVTQILYQIYRNQAMDVLKRADLAQSTPEKRSDIGILAEQEKLWTWESLQRQSPFSFTPPSADYGSSAPNRNERRMRAKMEREREKNTPNNS